MTPPTMWDLITTGDYLTLTAVIATLTAATALTWSHR